MRVLVLPSWYPSRSNPEAGIFVIEQIIALKRSGVHVGLGIIAARGASNDPIIDPRLDELKIPIIIHRVTGYPKVNRLMWQLWAVKATGLFRKVVDHFGAPDLIHAHSFMCGYVAHEILRKFGVPYIITEHYQGFNTSVRRRYVSIIRQVFKKAQFRIAVSSSLKSILEQYSGRDFHVIPNLIDDQLFQASIRSVENKIQLIAVGSLIKRKNFDLLINHFHKWRTDGDVEASLRIVGAGGENSRLQSLIKGLGAEDCISLDGHLSRMELVGALSVSHIYVSLSYSETFGVAALEALSCGLPILVRRSGGPESLVNSTNGVVIDEASYNTFASALDGMIANYKIYDHISIGKSIRDKFDSNAIAKQIISVYDRLLGSR